MIEEYESWEDGTRRTFIELATYMDKNSDPLEAIIDFAWASGADMFWVNNARDELKKLRLENSKVTEQDLYLKSMSTKIKEWSMEVFRANEFAVEQTNEYLSISSEMQSLKDSLENPVAWARINDRGDLFDLRTQNNPYIDQNTVVPLYRKN